MANKIDRLTFTRKRLVQDIERQVQKITECQADTEPIVLLSRKDALEELWGDFRTNTKEFESSQNWHGNDQFIEENGRIHETYLKGVAQITKLLPAETSSLQQSFTLFQRHRRNSEPNTSETGSGTAHNKNIINDQDNNNLHSSTPTQTTAPNLVGLQAADHHYKSKHSRAIYLIGLSSKLLVRVFARMFWTTQINSVILRVF